ncbi:efflux RND transporter permease subunit [Actimicrobium antarcticum]|uniref:RND family transporter n=1 Tax=Actimicrobium antarcticum TaxID=1051899 RepID=A0ABP7SXM7_9BURK
MIKRFSEFCILQRAWVAGLIALITLVLSYFALHVEVRTIFEDMLPSQHPYVKVHEKFKDTFGGSNMVTIMLEVDKGDIFQPVVLEKVRTLTQELRKVSAVNAFQIVSLASKKLKEVRASTGGIETRPLMWPDLPASAAEYTALRDAVLRNPMVYGPYVSTDLKATLVTVDFIDRNVDYGTVFKEINTLVSKVNQDGAVKIRVVGDPMLYGWVNYYLPETVHLVALALALTVVLLFLLLRTWRGMLLPFLAGLVSAIWALGICKLLNINFEPLVIVVAMLITSRAVSHSVQIINRFDDEIKEIAAGKQTSRDAARTALMDLFRPGMLGIVADAGCMAVVAMSPIPMLQKLTVLSVVWVCTLTVSAVVLTPILLSWIRKPQGYAHPFDAVPYLRRFLDFAVFVATSRFRYGVLACSAIVMVTSGVYAFNLKIGDANPGSPILWPDSTYNLDSAAINQKFQGADRMFVVVGGDERDLVKRTEVLDSMNRFQRFMEAQPEIGGSVSIADILPVVNRTLREGNPRYQELGETQAVNGNIMATLESVSEPGDMDRFVDATNANAAVTLLFRDRQGETIRTAIARIKEFVAQNPLDGVSYQLAGGLIGVMGAANEVILSSQIEALALALLVLVVICTVVYRSTVAGMLFMVPVIISNTLTFSFMAWKGIGMNINTVPVAALGIGLGVDYAFYIADRIKEELAIGATPEAAIATALHSAGLGVVVTASVLIFSTLLWSASSLRFQADMGLLMAMWLGISAMSALFVMPAIIYVFRPEFIFGKPRHPAQALPLVLGTAH